MTRTQRIRLLTGGILLGSFTLGLFAIQSATAFNIGIPPGKAFLGFWVGIDPLDGSTVQLSISDVENDGAIEIISREGFYTFCFDPSTNTKGRGKTIGTGTFLSKTVLSGTTSFTCIDDENNESVPSEGTFNYVLKSRGKILVIVGGETFPDILMHRTAK